MKILSIIQHPRNTNYRIAHVSGLIATHIVVYTELVGNRTVAYGGFSSTGAGSKYTKTYNLDRNEKMLNAFTEFLNA